MNLLSSPVRRWTAIAVAGALLILLISWLFFISPQRSVAADYDNQTADAQVQQVTATHALANLTEQNKHMLQYRAQLARLQAALPTSPETARLVTDLQRLSTSARVSITQISLTAPDPTLVTTGPTALPVIVNLQGRTANLERFLIGLQTVEPRAVLISSVTEAAGDTAAASAATGVAEAQPTMSLLMNAFFETNQ